MTRETLFWAIWATVILHVVSFESFKDNVLFDISWSGPVSLREGQVTKDGKDFLTHSESVFITTKNNEKYQCILPSEQIQNKPYNGEFGPGPDPADLIKSLADEGKCSYRLEAYWTYELCHGKHVRQFHDERTKGAKVLEFFLGRITPKEKESTVPPPIPPPPTADTDEHKRKPKLIPTRKVEGRDMPYYEVQIGNGTPCDLLGHRPREVHVLYLCHPQSHNEIMSAKEISTCTYEIEVLTPLLCSNEQYKFQEDPVHRINCHSFSGSPETPISYVELMEEQRIEQSGQKETMLFDNPLPEEPAATPQMDPSLTPQGDEVPPVDFQAKILTPKPDEQLTKDFLRGEHCLQGGAGWWKYELCYGKSVLQYHVDEEHGGRTDVLLGTWNKEKHIEWVSKKRRPTEYTTHLYTGGDICDLTGRPRQVQVRLKCKESSHLQEVSLFLMEPNICEYILGVESPIICPLLEKVDEYGLFPIE